MGEKITLTLPWPVSANRYWRTRVVKNIAMTYVSTEAKQYKSEVAWLAKKAGIRSPMHGRVSISYQLFPNRPQDYATRIRKFGDAWDDTVMCIDLDNAQKVMLDAMKGVVFDDDKWVRRITAERMKPDEHGARLVVTVTPMVCAGLFSEPA
jgi:crossover junction endodeoxyribonuclease RusA